MYHLAMMSAVMEASPEPYMRLAKHSHYVIYSEARSTFKAEVGSLSVVSSG